MESSIIAPAEAPRPSRHLRGTGRGSNFMVLSRPVWAMLCEAETANRMNLVSAFLVLLSGTGSDHRLTKWSAKACEEHVGMGKPRAKQAIEELIKLKLIERTEASTLMMPQYRLPEVPRGEEPIFLPTQIITGLGAGVPLIRRLREAGDFLALRMLIDLYGMIETDATHGVSIENLRETNAKDVVSRKVCEAGVNAVWALPLTTSTEGSGDWLKPQRSKGSEPWSAFFERLKLLKDIGAIWFEPWVYEGVALDAEPLFPVDPSVLYSVAPTDKAGELTQLLQEASGLLIGERTYLFERYYDQILVPFPLHHQAPAIRGVARMRVEADTPGCRMAYGKRMSALERAIVAAQQLIVRVSEGSFNQPVHYARPLEAS